MSVPVDALDVAACIVPTDGPESDGTLTWYSTTIVVAEVAAGGHTGLGYGSGGFTSCSVRQLTDQLAGWVEQDIPRVKMKVGRDPGADPDRVAAVRAAIGDDAELFVDANGAWTRKQALALAERFAESGVRWLEEPVSSDDLEGLRLVRDRGPAGMDIAAGEYGCDLPYFRDMLAAGAVDCLQADVTRCGGFTAFRRVAALCDAASVDLSATARRSSRRMRAPRSGICGIWSTSPTTYGIERLLFDGVLEPRDGALSPEPSRPGLGLELKRSDAERFAV